MTIAGKHPSEWVDGSDGWQLETRSGYCPVQAEGIVDGLPFYFRARGQRWSLSVAYTPNGDPVLAEEYAGFHHEEPWGETPYAAGWMEDDDALACIQIGIAKWREHVRALTADDFVRMPLDGCVFMERLHAEASHG